MSAQAHLHQQSGATERLDRDDAPGDPREWRRRPHVVIAVVNLPVERDRRVIRECLALEEAGYRVTVICPRGAQRTRVVPGTRAAAVRSFPQPFAGHGVASFALEFAWSFCCVAWHLALLTLSGRVSAVQVCNPPDVFWPLALVMRALGKAWVYDHHDVNPELYVAKTASPRRVIVWLLTLFERLSMRTASEVISTNESYREIAIRRGGCDPAKVTVVRNGPSLREIGARTAPAAPAPRRQEQQDTGSTEAEAEPVKRIVYVGVLNEQDYVDIAVLAAARLTALRGRQGWEMVIAGDGECLPELRRLAREQGVDDVVRFTGWLEAQEVDALLREATLGIQPDQRNPMSNVSTMAKTVEYMARGVPVVAVDLLETRRTAEKAGEYLPNGDPEEFAKAIDNLLDDEVRLAEMRAVALDRFATVLAWEHQAAAYVGVWRRLVPVPSAQRAGQS